MFAKIRKNLIITLVFLLEIFSFKAHAEVMKDEHLASDIVIDTKAQTVDYWLPIDISVTLQNIENQYLLVVNSQLNNQSQSQIEEYLNSRFKGYLVHLGKKRNPISLEGFLPELKDFFKNQNPTTANPFDNAKTYFLTKERYLEVTEQLKQLNSSNKGWQVISKVATANDVEVKEQVANVPDSNDPASRQNGPAALNGLCRASFSEKSILKTTEALDILRKMTNLEERNKVIHECLELLPNQKEQTLDKLTWKVLSSENVKMVSEDLEIHSLAEVSVTMGGAQ